MTYQQAEIVGRYGQAVGLDFSAQMLEAARAKEKDHPNCHVQFVEGDALALPFPDDSFDAATSGFALRNVSDIPLAIREMARVVRAAARLSASMSRALVFRRRVRSLISTISRSCHGWAAISSAAKRSPTASRPIPGWQRA